MSPAVQAPPALSSRAFWSEGLRDLMTKEQRPGHLLHLAYQFLDSLPGSLGKAVADAAKAEVGDEGRPHRAAEARRILPFRVSAVAHYCRQLPEEVASWVCMIAEVLNFLYLGGKKVLGGEILTEAQRSALEGITQSVEDFLETEERIPVSGQLRSDLGRIRFDYAGDMVAVMEELEADKVIACWPPVGQPLDKPAFNPRSAL